MDENNIPPEILALMKIMGMDPDQVIEVNLGPIGEMPGIPEFGIIPKPVMPDEAERIQDSMWMRMYPHVDTGRPCDLEDCSCEGRSTLTITSAVN